MAGVFAVSTVGVGVVAGCLLVGWIPASVLKWAQIPGGLLLLWAIFADMHEEIATWAGETPHERLNRRLFLSLSGSGALLLAVGTTAGLL